jgi:DNA polymerase V
MIGLIDCNNFYVSCERVFNPSLRNKPVIILSNNDGCAISRSNEAKTLGVKMGAPAFMIDKLIRENDIKVYSSNYTLYGDMSHRVMSLLESFVPEMEIYSIDEAFLFFNGISERELLSLGKRIIQTITRNTGIPVSLGIAQTKTLAKMSNKLAKKSSRSPGIYVMNEKKREEILQSYPVADVWGIGSQHAALLKKNGILTAYDFTKTPKGWVQKHLTVVGLRLWEELQGRPTIAAEPDIPDKKNICTSRSFGSMQTEYLPIEEATATYAMRCAEKLRKQKSCARVMMVFLHTNQFRNDLPQYAKNIVIQLPVPTNSSLELVHYAKVGLRKIFRSGYSYKKSGIILSDFVPQNQQQQNMFDTRDRSKHSAIMEVIDSMNNRHGRDTLRIATQGFTQKWKLRQENLSRCYSTRWEEMIEVRI